MENDILKRRKWIIFGSLGVVIVILIISLIFIIRNNTNTATIDILVAPTTAKVKIDGREYGGVGEYEIHPGEYTAEISAEGFVARTVGFVAKDGETTKIRAYLDPDGGSVSPEDADIGGDIMAMDVMEKMTNLKIENPIIEKMPIKIDYYTPDYSKRVWYVISYKVNEDLDSLYLTVTDYTGGNYERALDELKARGYDPSGYEVKYIDKTQDLSNGKAM